jgi:DNA-binding winged helix-turn-helix (wHTH) protein
MMRARQICTFLVAAALAGTAAESVVAQRYRSDFDNIRTFRNGNTQVTVSSACVATYDARGYRINNGRCSGDDITRADQQYADYRAQFGNNRPLGGNRGYGPNPGTIRTLRNGNTQVTVSSACVATYDARGYRINNGRCSDDDITRADQQYADYRRFGGNRGYGPN